MARKRKTADRTWLMLALAVLAGAAAARLGFNALGLVPAHFDEAQYWSWGLAPAFGYFSKPPLIAWAIRGATGILGDTLFALRVLAPLCHLWIGWLIFATARRLHDARTGFWASAGYTAAPGVTVSAGLMTTDPLMMLGWAGALWALAVLLGPRKAKAPPAPVWLWAVAGASLGAAMLAKYTAIALAGGMLGYALFSRQGAWQWRGPLLAAGAFLAVWSPNLLWLAANGFVTVTHITEDAGRGGSGLSVAGPPEFLASQLGVIGPVFFPALVWALWRRAAWRTDWRPRLLAWAAAPLLLAITLQSLGGGANPNWAAPAYVSGSILAAWWLLRIGWRRALQVQLWSGLAAAILLWGLAAVYGLYGAGLPRAPDPFKKMRMSGPLCEAVIAAMEETGITTLLSGDRRRLYECAFVAGLSPDQLRIWNPEGRVANHLDLTASLTPGDTAPMLLFLVGRDGEREAARFASAELLESDVFATHADAEYDFVIWRVEGFRGY
jgi:4-amino-4-deoxy-L-arabinose transferase-like glycosyltransferase